LDSLPLHGSSSHAKQTDASKAAAQLKKVEKAQKVAAQKLLAAEAKETAAKKSELLSKVKDFKAGKPIAAPTLSHAPYVLTPASRAELLRACIDAFRSAPARQQMTEVNERLLDNIRTELAPIALSCDDVIGPGVAQSNGRSGSPPIAPGCT
jgi:hypothetical protein